MSTEDDKKILLEKNRRLQQLKVTKAKFGINTPPEILNEIEDIETELEQLEGTLKVIKETSKATPFQNETKNKHVLWSIIGAITLIFFLAVGICVISFYFSNSREQVAEAGVTTSPASTETPFPTSTIVTTSPEELSPPTVTPVQTEEPGRPPANTQPVISLSPEETSTPTSTPIPTIAPSPVSVSVPISTFTPIPPTLTSTPTNIPLPTPTDTPTPTPCPIPAATHKLKIPEGSSLWVDAREECAKAHSGYRPDTCTNVNGGEVDGPGSILLGTFGAGEHFIYSIQSEETPTNIPDFYDRPPWPIKFFWKAPPDFFKNATNGHFIEAPNQAWFVLNEPHTNNPALFSVSFLQPGVQDAQFQEECSTKDYSIISVMGYINAPNLHLGVEKLN